MTKFLSVLILAGMAVSAPAWAENTCINTRDITSSTSKDGKTLVFQMRDGKIYVNHLQGVCPGLRYDGFVWVLRGGDTKVCENMQTLRVLRSGEVCALGKFDPPRMRQVKN